VSAELLALLVAAITALLGLGTLAAVWPRQCVRIVWGAAIVASFAAMIAMLDVLLAEPRSTAGLPLALAGEPLRLAIDPLAALFAALLFAAGAATLAFVAATEKAPAATAIPVCLGLLGIAVLGQNGFTQGLGLAFAGTAIWLSGPSDRSGAVQLGLGLLAAAAIFAAPGVPPQARIWAVLIGPGALAGLMPLHRWTAPAHCASTHAAALLSGATVPAALYVMLRVLLPSHGMVPPAWWGLPLSLAGAAAAVIGGLDAVWAPDLETALAAGTMRQTGLATLGIGVALTASGEDLPAVATMALAAVLLLAVLQAMGGTLLALACGAIRDGAGSRRLERLGGVVRRMPVTTVCLLAGLTGLATVPASAGFAAAWLLLHAFLGLPHAGSLPAQLLRCALVAGLGLASALGSAGALRMVGVACLGRPRTPRAAVADEPSRSGRIVLVALAFLATAWGVLVGPLLMLFAEAPMRVLTGSGLGPLATPLGLAVGPESPGYAALPIACLVAVAGGLVVWLRRWLGMPGATTSGPAWEDGFAAPPAWLPFGDPGTQTAGTDFAPSAMRILPLPPALVRFAAQAYKGGEKPSLCPRPTPTPSGPGPAMTRRIANLRLPPQGSAPAIILVLLAGLLILCSWAGVS